MIMWNGSLVRKVKGALMGEKKKRRIVGLMLTSNIPSLFITQSSTHPAFQFLHELSFK